MATRYTATTGEPTDLTSQIYRNGVKSDVYAIVGVYIYSNDVDAQNDVNPIAFIEGVDCLRIAEGKYQYTAPIIATPGEYFDKIHFEPLEGSPVVTSTNRFTVSEFIASVPQDVPTCRIIVDVIDPEGNPQENDEVTFIVDNVPAIEINSSKGIVPKPIVKYTDEAGSVVFNLIRGATYRVSVRSMGYHAKVIIPQEVEASLWALAPVSSVGDPTPTDQPPESNW